MQVKLLQLLVELSQRLTKKEAAMQHAQIAEKQAAQLSKSAKRRWNQGKKEQAATHPSGKKPKSGKPTPNQASSSGVGPSGLFKDKQVSEEGQGGEQGAGKKRYPSTENSAEKPPRKINKDDLTVALQNVNLGGRNTVKQVEIPKSEINSIETKTKEVSEPKTPVACEKIIHPECLNCSDDEVQVTYA